MMVRSLARSRVAESMYVMCNLVSSSVVINAFYLACYIMLWAKSFLAIV